MLLANILAGYKIDWARVMVEQIHKSGLWMNTSLLFPILIHRLCNEARVRISLHIDPHIKALHTMDPSLIKTDENPVALQRAAPPPIPEPFPHKPSIEVSTPAATTSTPVIPE